jgi:UDP-N-acetylmuramoylalanine--D-glutamate ligase
MTILNAMNRSFTIHKGKKSQVEHFMHARKRMLEELNEAQHRLEEVDELDSVTYINDSSATGIMATLDSLRCITDPVVWICQATPYDRDFILLSRIVKHKVRAIVVVGQEASDVRSSLGAVAGRFEACKDLESAVEQAREWAEVGDAVLFSPSCPAGRFFEDVAHRGERFKDVVATFRQ